MPPKISPLKTPGIDIEVERQLPDLSGIVREMETTGSVNGVPISGGSSTGTVTSVDASGGVETESGSPITASGTIRGAEVLNNQTGTSYTFQSSDRGALVTFSNTSAIAGTLPQAGVSFPADWYCDVQNRNTGALTITPTTSTIDGLASITIGKDEGVRLVSDGTNYFTIRTPKAEFVNSQTGTTYTYVKEDRAKLVTHSNASAIAGTLPQAGTAFSHGWWMDVQNRGAGTLTITPSTSTIDGVASLQLRTGEGCRIVSDGTNYFAMRGRKTTLLFSYLWQSESPAQTGTHKRFYVDRAGTITAVRPNVVKGDGTSTLNIDVLKNGTTIYPSAAKPSVGAGNFVNGSFPPDTTSFVDGDYLQINITATGGTTGAVRLIIKFEEA
jgi:hypothetical protein